MFSIVTKFGEIDLKTGKILKFTKSFDLMVKLEKCDLLFTVGTRTPNFLGIQMVGVSSKEMGFF